MLLASQNGRCGVIGNAVYHTLAERCGITALHTLDMPFILSDAASMNYCQVLIAVADDCPVSQSVVPENRAGKKTVALLQYEMLAQSPYVHTQEE